MPTGPRGLPTLTTFRGIHGYCEENIQKDGAVNRESAGFVAPGQTSVVMTGKIALNVGSATSVNLLTVPTGKLFFITDIFLSHDDTVALDTRIQTVNGSQAVDLMRAPVKGDTAPLEMPGLESQPFLTAGCTLTLVFASEANASKNGYWTICGIQQDVGVG